MSDTSTNQCRFCPSRDQSLVKYNVRHYAHFHCYLDAGKRLSDLHAWQVGHFPHRLLKERGLLDEAAAIIERGKKEDEAFERRLRRISLSGKGGAS